MNVASVESDKVKNLLDRAVTQLKSVTSLATNKYENTMREVRNLIKVQGENKKIFYALTF
jgi:hypothetical protein